MTVLDETEPVAGIEARVVEERATEDGELTEIARNYFAFCPQNGGVFNFGEDTEYFVDGAVVSTEGSWRVGEAGAEAGLQMPAIPLLGARYYQEVAPGVALDRGEVVAVDETIATPAGTFDGCLVVEETNPLEPDAAASTKRYAPGVGLVGDDALELVRYGDVGAYAP